MSSLAEELTTIDLGDQRLNRRARWVLEALYRKPGSSISAACGGWKEVKGAYRLFEQEAVTAQQILEPHYQSSAERMAAHPVVLCVQDTTELDYTGKQIDGLGPLNYETRQGLYMHPTLAVTPERLCLGVLDAWNWVREPGSLGQSVGSHRPITEKESIRWLEGYQRVNELAAQLPDTQLVYMADREADIYELFAEGEQARAAGLRSADWLVRGAQDRCLSDEQDEKLKAAVRKAQPISEIEFDLPSRQGGPARHVRQSLKVTTVRLKPPYRVGYTLEPVTVTVLLAEEIDPPSGQPPLTWLLLTNRSVTTAEHAAELLSWYLCRWQIELFFKILKSGCKVEELQLRTLDRLEPALALYLIIAWRILYLTRLGRTCPELPCDAVFADEEWHAAYIVTHRQPPPETPPSLNEMIGMIAAFGGFLNRKGDGFPGSESLWIGLTRCHDFVIALQAQRAFLEQQQRYG
jgi:hypothetical protein